MITRVDCIKYKAVGMHVVLQFIEASANVLVSYLLVVSLKCINKRKLAGKAPVTNFYQQTILDEDKLSSKCTTNIDSHTKLRNPIGTFLFRYLSEEKLKQENENGNQNNKYIV